ncbi:Gfo/Idh/MocA family oxidoreductase [soil metagenome]
MTMLPADLPLLDVVPGQSTAAPLPPDRPVRWGILATGGIAQAFATDLALLSEVEIAAVASRRLESAQEFAAAHGVGKAYGAYAELVEDPEVDVVYVATPHALHKEHTLLALEAGKPVLCEKAITLREDDAADLVAAARTLGLFLMEAMWMRCNPVIRRLQQVLDSGAVGSVQQVRADLGFVVDRPPTDRLLDPALGGGVLLDMGIYPLTFAYLFLGEPTHVTATAAKSEAGIDVNLAVAQSYDSGAVAALTASMTGHTPRTASIATDRGVFELTNGFHHPTSATWTSSSGEVETLREPVIGTGLANEALEVVRCLRNGETQSPLVPLEDTVALMRQMDAIRDQIGVRYPGERH